MHWGYTQQYRDQMDAYTHRDKSTLLWFVLKNLKYERLNDKRFFFFNFFGKKLSIPSSPIGPMDSLKQANFLGDNFF